MISDEVILDFADAMRKTAADAVRDGEAVPITVFVVATMNPVTGEAADEAFPVIPLVLPSTMSKARFGDVVRSVCQAAKARAAIMVADAWAAHIKLDHSPATFADAREALRDQPRASEHPDRRECIACAVELGARVVRIETPYVRDQGQILFEEPTTIITTADKYGGTFKFLTEPVDDSTMTECRNMAAYMLLGVPWVGLEPRVSS